MRSRVQAGDPAAFGELFDRYARAVYNHAFRLLGSWADAEDVVSLTFLEAWRLRSRVDDDPDDGSLGPWLLGIATNVARNTRRAARRYDDAYSRLPRTEIVPDFADDVAGRLHDQERLARVSAALAALRRPEREVLALCVWSGLDYAQAARALGVPVGTVRSRLSRARTRLAQLIDDGRLPMEPAPGPGQVPVDRDPAVPIASERTR